MFGRTSPERGVAPQPTGNDTPVFQPTLLTILGGHAKLEGKFDIADSIRIECEIGGELNVGGKLVIGEQGVVRADVKTVDAIVQGRYEGNMVATGNVEITATGRVSGNVETDSLVIAKGGFFNGDVVRFKEWVGEGDDARRLSGSPEGEAEERVTRRPYWPRKVSESGSEGDQGIHRFRGLTRSASGADASQGGSRVARSSEVSERGDQSDEQAAGRQTELALPDGREAEARERPEAVELGSALRTDSPLRPQDPGEEERVSKGGGEEGHG